VVIFAYHYPPANAIGGARPFRFVKYLTRLGYTCRVFTAACQDGHDDPNTVYVPDPFVTRSRRSFSWQSERAMRKLFLPGEVGVHWAHQACLAATGYIRAHPSARVTIFSTFPPLGAHLAGWQLARRNNLVWVADCRDPLADEFTHQHRTFSQRRVYRWLERVVLKRADTVIANTDSALVEWQEKFPSLRKQFQLIWNGFDPEDRVKPLPVCRQDCRILSHVGELYHGRNATPILESITRLIAANRLSAGRLLVRLMGSAQTDCLPSPEFIRQARSKGWLELVAEKVPQKRAREVAQTSTGLLLIQTQSTTQVPGKLFEYLQIGRPILAFIQPNSPSERLLAQSGVPYRCVYPASAPEEIDDVVAGFFDLPSTPVVASPWFEEQFNAEHQTRTLDCLIRSLHAERLDSEHENEHARSELSRQNHIFTRSAPARQEHRRGPHP